MKGRKRSISFKTTGTFISSAVQGNLRLFWKRMESLGFCKDAVLSSLQKASGRLKNTRIDEIHRMARDAVIAFEDLLAFNLWEDLAFREGCTVMIALGSASASGTTIALKNSDKVGNYRLVGPQYHNHKEINVLLDGISDSGHRILGVAAAGSLGLKMGMNDAGVATTSNISRTIELLERHVEIGSLLAADRSQLMRDGLEFSTARAAAEATIHRLTRAPMSTPGNLAFMDKEECWIIEGSYSQLAVEVLRGNRVAARSNHFILLQNLNDSDGIAGYKRYARSMELLSANYGHINRDKMIDFSMDHANGPGPNSICRHGTSPMEETTLSAMVMEVDPVRPEKSTVSISLGKSCHAWRCPCGNITLPLDCPSEAIPSSLLNGETWKLLYQEQPWEG